MSHPHLAALLAAYIEAALWSSTDNSRDDGGDPLDKNHGPGDLSPECLARMTTDCTQFLERNAATIEAATCARNSGQYEKHEQAGHDFWLTRNGHGVGFWDGDWSEPQADTLTKAAKAFGEVNLYVGDDGKVHHD